LNNESQFIEFLYFSPLHRADSRLDFVIRRIGLCIQTEYADKLSKDLILGEQSENMKDSEKKARKKQRKEKLREKKRKEREKKENVFKEKQKQEQERKKHQEELNKFLTSISNFFCQTNKLFFFIIIEFFRLQSMRLWTKLK
jgi:hypothetical protein